MIGISLSQVLYDMADDMRVAVRVYPNKPGDFESIEAYLSTLEGISYQFVEEGNIALLATTSQIRELANQDNVSLIELDFSAPEKSDVPEAVPGSIEERLSDHPYDRLMQFESSRRPVPDDEIASNGAEDDDFQNEQVENGDEMIDDPPAQPD